MSDNTTSPVLMLQQQVQDTGVPKGANYQITYVATVGATGLTSGNGKQFVTQLIAVGAAAAYAVIVTFVITFAIEKTIGLRVEKEDEIMGLDQTQHSESAYNN